jgi:hypothetical protein
MAKNNLAKRQKSDSSAESVFVYTGPGCFVPKDVVRVQFDASVVEVSIHAFFNCIKLREVVLNDGLQKIVRGAFCYCTSLRHITLPSTITEVGRYAFHNCQNLREVVLNEGGLQKINDDALRASRTELVKPVLSYCYFATPDGRVVRLISCFLFGTVSLVCHRC